MNFKKIVSTDSARVGNQTEWVDVRVGINMKDNVEIFGDLNEGDQLALKANDEIKPQTNVVAFQ